MDRVVEYLVGDGPNNRYALICRQCQSHNGMALKEEFEYIGRTYIRDWVIWSKKDQITIKDQIVMWLGSFFSKITDHDLISPGITFYEDVIEKVDHFPDHFFHCLNRPFANNLNKKILGSLNVKMKFLRVFLSSKMIFQQITM